MYRPTHFTAGNPEFRSRNKCLVPLISCCLIFFLAGFARAGSAIRALNPGSGDWNTAANWTSATVPNGASETAFFDLSNTTELLISANTEVNGIVFDSNAGLSPFTITASPGFTFTISGVGITNNSGVNQTFKTVADTFGSNPGTIVFSNTSTAGSAIIANNFGQIRFFDNSTAGSATITNNGPGSIFPSAHTDFFSGTAGTATIRERAVTLSRACGMRAACTEHPVGFGGPSPLGCKTSSKSNSDVTILVRHEP